MRTALLLCMAALGLAPWQARALSISVVAPAAVELGAYFDVELRVLGAPELGDFAAPSVRAFDLDLGYDTSMLAFGWVNFSEFLGWPYSQLVSASDLGGVVDLKEVSLLSGSALDASQPRDFPIATLTFQALGTGSTLLELTQRDVADVAGARLAVSGPSSAGVEIVPEPVTGLLFAGGLVALAAHRRGPRTRGRSLSVGPR